MGDDGTTQWPAPQRCRRRDPWSRVRAAAAAHPDAPAVVHGAETLSYAGLIDAVQRIAGGLRSVGVAPGRMVGIALPGCTHLAAAVLGVMGTGAAYVPLDPRYPRERLRFMATDTEIAVVVCERAAVDEWRADGWHAVAIEDLLRTPPARSQYRPAPEDLAYVIYTSGSTGRPKGVAILQRNLVAHLGELDAVLSPRGTWLAMTSLNFDPSVVELLWTTANGCSIVVHDLATGIPPLGELLATHPVTHLQLTPTTAHLLVDDPAVAAGLRGARQLLIGGELLTPALVARLQEVMPACRILNVYGPTETTVWSTAGPVRPGEPVTVGMPMQSTSVVVVDEQLRPVPIDTVGEIVIGGEGVAAGYWRRPDLDAAAFVPDPMGSGSRAYRTGDLGMILADGCIVVLGRRDQQVKLHGVRIELGEVEAVLEEMPGVRRAVVAVEGTGLDARLVAHVQAVAGARLDVAALRSAAATRLSGAMVPRFFRLTDSFPTTPTGKVDRRALPVVGPSDAAVPVAAGSRSAGPGGRAEPPSADGADLDRMRALWADVLHVPTVDADTDFFDAGGTSVAAARLFVAIRRTFGVSLPLATLTLHRTVRELTGAVAEARSGTSDQPWPCLVSLRSGEGGSDIVLVHGRAGNIVNLQVLADRLPVAHAVHALQARGLDGTTPPHRTITEMAEAYLEEVRPVLVADEVVIAGYSGGGLVAIEMARRLRAEGASVRSVVLLDTALPGIDSAGVVRRLVRRAQDEGRDLPRFVVDRLRLTALRVLGRSADEDRGVDLGPHFDVADATHRLAPYDGAVTVVRARTWTESADLGWGPYLTGPVTLHDVRGGHVRMLLPPHVDEVARILAAVSVPRGFTVRRDRPAR